MKKNIILIAIVVFYPSIVFAGNLTIPNSFTPNTPALASEVNENFHEIKVQVDDNDQRLKRLESGSLTIAGVSLAPSQSYFVHNISHTSLQNPTTILGDPSYASVNLPDGAIVTGVEMLVKDTDAYISARLCDMRRDLDPDSLTTNICYIVASLDSSMNNEDGIALYASNDISSQPINNNNENFYLLKVYLSGLDSEFYYFKIHYVY